MTETRLLEDDDSLESSVSSRELVEGFVRGRISIIMPAYNEANCIRQSIVEAKKQFETVCEDYEIIVVDDGSTDDTYGEARDPTDERVKIVRFDRNVGKGNAIKAGFYRATGEFTFIMDSDSEIMAADLRTFVDALQLADVAIGSKRHPQSVVRTPPMRRFLSLAYNITERLLTGTRVSDSQAGFKAVKSKVLYACLPLLSVKKYAFDLEFLVVASLRGFKVKELPVNIDLNASVNLNRLSRMLVDTLGIAYRLRVRRWYQKNLVSFSNTYDPIIHW